MNFDKFHMVAVISNPIQYKSRYELYRQFQADFKQQGVTLWTVELQTGSRPFVLTQKDCINHIQLSSSALPGELWYKENLINLAINHITRLAPDWRYLGWTDADFLWEPGAVKRTYDALQHYDVVQMLSHLINFNPDGTVTDQASKGFIFCYQKGIIGTNKNAYQQGVGFPGGAWAARREALNRLGCALGSPLIDWAILGAGDRNFACAMVGKMKWSVDPGFSPNYQKWMYIYEQNAIAAINKNVGYVHNTVRHLFHGRVVDRGYENRGDILMRWKFDPETDLAKDVSGVWRLVINTPRQMGLRDDIRKYFRARKEDATTL